MLLDFVIELDQLVRDLAMNLQFTGQETWAGQLAGNVSQFDEADQCLDSEDTLANLLPSASMVVTDTCSELFDVIAGR